MLRTKLSVALLLLYQIISKQSSYRVLPFPATTFNSFDSTAFNWENIFTAKVRGVARLLTGEVKVSARKGYVTNNKRFRDWEQRAEQLVADVLSNPSVSSSVYFINSFIIVYFINSSKLALH